MPSVPFIKKILICDGSDIAPLNLINGYSLFMESKTYLFVGFICGFYNQNLIDVYKHFIQ